MKKLCERKDLSTSVSETVVWPRVTIDMTKDGG